jgi:hypothetical protein
MLSTFVFNAFSMPNPYWCSLEQALTSDDIVAVPEFCRLMLTK